MPQSSQWKAAERKVAKDLGGKRTGPRGFNTPDVYDVPGGLAPEVKYQGRLSLKAADIAQAEKNARGSKWALFLFKARSSKKYVVVEYDYFLELYKKANDYE